MSEAVMWKEAINQEDYTPAAAKAAGEVVELPDGRAGVVITDLAASQAGAVYTKGIFKMAKTTSMVVIKGQLLYWDATNSKVKYTGDFPVGTAFTDGLAADTTIYVVLNGTVNPRVSLQKGRWNKTETLGLGVTRNGEEFTLAMDAVAEASTAAIYSTDSVACADDPVWEGWVAIYDIGDDAALDINFGLANGTHATDCDSITESCFFHLDGSALSILVESDDGTTEVAADDSTIVAVDDTYAFYQIDARDLSDVKAYINGVLQGGGETLVLSAATGPLIAIVHCEKTSNDTTCDVRVKDMHIRTVPA